MSSARPTSGPDFIIIGAMKCMTSTLHEQLAAQRGVFMTDPKEPCYFSDDEVYRRGAAWYASLFASARPGDLRGESSTHYAKLPTHTSTIERLRDALPNAKLIYVMRHPIDRLESHYVHEWTQRVVSEPIDKAIDRLPTLIAYSRYAYQLQGYLEAFGLDRVLPVFFDRLVADPQRELERIGRYIGYPRRPEWRPNLAADNVSAMRMRRSAWRDPVAYAPGVSWVRRKLVPQSVRDLVKRHWQMRAKPVISPESRRRLTELFDEDLARLGEWLGVRLTCESFRETTAARALEWRRGTVSELKPCEAFG